MTDLPPTAGQLITDTIPAEGADTPDAGTVEQPEPAVEPEPAPVEVPQVDAPVGPIGQEVVEPEPTTPEPEQVAPPVEVPEQTLVKLDSPWMLSAWTSSDKLTIDRTGVLVPTSDVQNLFASATVAGIGLKVG